MQPTVEPKGEDGVKMRYDSLLARREPEYRFLDYVFVTPGLKGAVGTTMVPITPEEYERREAEYRDYETSPLAHLYHEERQDGLADDWDEWIDAQFVNYGPEVIVDMSYVSKGTDFVPEKISHDIDAPTTYGEIVSELAVRELGYDAVELVECVGGGRMFGTTATYGKMDEVYDEEAWRIAYDTEENEHPEWARGLV